MVDSCSVPKCTLKRAKLRADAEMEFVWRSIYCELSWSETLKTRGDRELLMFKWTLGCALLWNAQCILKKSFILINRAALFFHWLAFVMRLAKNTKDFQAQISFPWGCISYWNKTFRLHVTKDSFWKRKTAFSSCHSHEWWFATARIWLDKHLDAPMKSRWVINNLGLLSQNNFPEF